MRPISLAERHEAERAHGRTIVDDAERIWAQSTKAGRMRIKRRCRFMIDYCALRPGVRVLELGCGLGNYTALLAETGTEIVAIDLSEDLLARARQRLPQVTFLCTPAEELAGIDDASIDCVVGNAVVHHTDILLTLRAVLRVLKPGGRMCFTEPNMLNPQIFFQKHIPAFKKWYGDVPHEVAFVRWPLIAQLGNLGFTEISVQPFDFLHPLLPDAVATTVDKVSRVLERIPLLKEIGGSVVIRARKPIPTSLP